MLPTNPSTIAIHSLLRFGFPIPTTPSPIWFRDISSDFRLGQGLQPPARPRHRLPCGAPPVAVRRRVLYALAEIARATCQPCPARYAFYAPQSCCQVLRHRPAPRVRAAPGLAGCAPEEQASGVDRALPRSKSTAVWVARFASKPSSILDVSRDDIVYLLMGHWTSSGCGKSSGLVSSMPGRARNSRFVN